MSSQTLGYTFPSTDPLATLCHPSAIAATRAVSSCDAITAIFHLDTIFLLSTRARFLETDDQHAQRRRLARSRNDDGRQSSREVCRKLIYKPPREPRKEARASGTRRASRTTASSSRAKRSRDRASGYLIGRFGLFQHGEPSRTRQTCKIYIFTILRKCLRYLGRKHLVAWVYTRLSMSTFEKSSKSTL